STVIFSPPHRLRLSDGAETHDLEAPCPLRRSVLPVTDCSLVYLRAISARGIYTNPLSPATRHPSLSRVRGIIILVDLLTRSIQQRLVQHPHPRRRACQPRHHAPFFFHVRFHALLPLW